MANGEKVKKDKLPEPTFIEQANVLIDKKFEEAKEITNPDYGPGLKPWDHKLWVAVMDLHVKYVNDVLVEGYDSKVAEHYDPIMALLQKIDGNYDEVKKELVKLNKRQNRTDERISEEEEEILNIKKELVIKKKRIDDLMLQFQDIQEIVHPEVIHEFLEKIESVTPKLDKIIIINQPKTIRRRVIKSIAIAVLICIIIIDFAFWIHSRNTNQTNKTIPQTEQPKDSTEANTSGK